MANPARHQPHRPVRPAGIAVAGHIVQQDVVDQVRRRPDRRRPLHQRRRADRQDALDQQPFRRMARVGARAIADREIDLALIEGHRLHVRRHPDLDLGMKGVEVVHAGHQPFGRERGRDADRDLTATRRLTHEGRDVAQPVQPLGHQRRRRTAQIGQLQPPGFALEQGGANDLLELPDLLADGAGGDRQLLRRTREAQVPRGAFEDAQGVQGQEGSGHR